MRNYKRRICFLLVFCFVTVIMPSAVWAEEMPAEAFLDLETLNLHDEQNVLDENYHVVIAASQFSGNWERTVCGAVYNNVSNEILMVGQDKTSAVAEREIYIPKTGYYYVSGRALANAGADSLTGTFFVSFEQNGVEHFLEAAGLEENAADELDDLADSQNKYVFGAGGEAVISDADGFFVYADAEPVYLEDGFAVINLYGRSGAAVDYLFITDYAQQGIACSEDYDDFVGIYEDTEPPVFIEEVKITDEIREMLCRPDGYMDFIWEVRDNSGGCATKYYAKDYWDTEWYVEEGYEYICRSFRGYPVWAYKAYVVAYDFTGNMRTSEMCEIYHELENGNALVLTSDNVKDNQNWQITDNADVFNSTGKMMQSSSSASSLVFEVFVPDSGEYFIDGRALASDGSFGGFTVEIEQESQVFAAEKNGESLYFGAFDEAAETLTFQHYTSDTVHLNKGRASVTVYADSGAAADYIALCRGIDSLPESKWDYDCLLGFYEDNESPQFIEEPAEDNSILYFHAKDRVHSFDREIAFYSIDKIHADDRIEHITTLDADCTEFDLAEAKIGYGMRLCVTAYDNHANSVTSNPVKCDSYMLRSIILTGNEFSGNRFSKDSNAKGAWNHNFGSYLLAQSGDFSDRYAKYTIRVPEDGKYYVGARMKTTLGNTAQTNYYKSRTMQVSFTQNGEERFVEGINPWSPTNLYNFDSYTTDGINRYLFGSMRDYVSSLQSYNYIDALPIELKAGEAEVTIYANSYARLDYLVISKDEILDISTQEDYDNSYGLSENDGNLAFVTQPEIVLDNGKKVLTYQTNKEGGVFYEIYDVTNGKNDFLYQTGACKIDVARFHCENAIDFKVVAYDGYNNRAESNVISYAPTAIESAVILVNGKNTFTSQYAYASDECTFHPFTDAFDKNAFNQATGRYLIVNNLENPPVKHTTRVYVPKTGTYYVSSRALSRYNKNTVDPKFGAFQVSFVQDGKETFVQGKNPISDGEDMHRESSFDSFNSNGTYKYLFGAQRAFVTENYEAYMYTDAQPITLTKGFADLHIYAYPHSAFDYIAITDKKPISSSNKQLYDITYGGLENTNEPVFLQEVEYDGGKDAAYNFYYEAENAAGYALYAIDGSENYILMGYSDKDTTCISCEELLQQNFRAVSLVAFNAMGKFAECRRMIENPRNIFLLTPANHFVVDESDAQDYPDTVWKKETAGDWRNDPATGVFNGSSQGSTFFAGKSVDEIGKRQIVRMQTKIYIPHAGNYKVLGRAASSASTADNYKYYERIFGVTLTQNGVEKIVTGPQETTFFITPDRYNGNTYLSGLYAFGMKRDFVTDYDLSCYNYDEADPIYLEEGETIVTVYGYSFARMDYLVIADCELQMPETKAEYDADFAHYEDVSAPVLTEPLQIKQTGNSTGVLSFKVNDNGGILSNVVYNIYNPDKLLYTDKFNESLAVDFWSRDSGKLVLETTDFYYNKAVYEQAFMELNPQILSPSAALATTIGKINDVLLYKIVPEITGEYNFSMADDLPVYLELHALNENGYMYFMEGGTNFNTQLEAGQTYIVKLSNEEIDSDDCALRVILNTTVICSHAARTESGNTITLSLTAEQINNMFEREFILYFDPEIVSYIDKNIGIYSNLNILEKGRNFLKFQIKNYDASNQYSWSGILHCFQFSVHGDGVAVFSIEALPLR